MARTVAESSPPLNRTTAFGLALDEMDSDMNDGSLDLRVQRFVVLAGWLRQKRAQTAAVWAKWRATYNFVAHRRADRALLACDRGLLVKIKIQLQHIHPRFAQQAKLSRRNVRCNQAPHRIFAYMPLGRHARHL